jgi:N-acetylmuramoyl-L-alanine amidase
MAKWCAAGLLAGLFALGGCQAQHAESLVKNLPPPNFDGPDLTPAPAPQPVVVLAPPAPPVQPPVTPPKQPAARPALAVPAEWVPSIRANGWRWIVIHHSATPNGSAAAFDRMHKNKGWDELGYHFVVGNGSETGDGQVEVGPRWRKQKWGAHAKTPDNKYNDFGIGICLVGNFDVNQPTWRQMNAVAKLVAHLQRTYNIPADRVIGHGTVRTIEHVGTSTACPGRNLNVAQVRRQSAKVLADAGEPVPASAHAAATAGADLLYDTTEH